MSKFDQIIRDAADAKKQQDAADEARRQEFRDSEKLRIEARDAFLDRDVIPVLREMARSLSASKIPNTLNLDSNPPAFTKSLTIGAKGAPSVSRKVVLSVIPDDQEVLVTVNATPRPFEQKWNAPRDQVGDILTQAFTTALKYWHGIKQ
jgi:hypothetical protein